MRVLVELSDRLGEMVTDIALMRTLAAGMPGCYMEVVVADHMTGVIEDCAFIHRRNIYSVNGFVNVLFANFRAGTQRWDAYIRTAEESRLQLARLFMRASVTRTPDNRDPALAGDGMLVHRLSVLEGILPHWKNGIEARIPLLEGRIEHAMKVVGIQEGEKVLTVAPGSSDGIGHWPSATSIKVVNELKGDFDRVLLLGRASDNALCNKLAAAVGGFAVAGNLPLPYALGLLEFAQLHIGTDHCMAHAAAAFGTPTLCVGGTDDLYNRPWRQRMLPGNPEDIAPELAIEQARALLA